MKFNLLHRLSLGVFLSSFFGYLHWGQDYHAWLWEAEWKVINTFIENPQEALHPFTVVPMLGQILILLSFFIRKYARQMNLAGCLALGFLLLFLLFVGILSKDWRIWGSCLPFLVFFYARMRHWKKEMFD